MNRINIQYCKSPLGDLILGSFEGKLCLLDYRFRSTRTSLDNRLKKGRKAEFFKQEDEITKTTVRQLDEYLKGNRKNFDIPILTVGTAFQKSVWNALQQIPYGKTVSYQTIAQKIGKPRAVRAVASAIGANAISIIIPCHRVIGKDGKLTGYAGGLEVKRKLLELEQSSF